jgi:hypothetical protein
VCGVDKVRRGFYKVYQGGKNLTVIAVTGGHRDRYPVIATMICTPNFTTRVCYYHQSAYRVHNNISRHLRVIRQFSQASRDSNGTTVIPPYIIVGCCVPIGMGCAYYACLDTVPYTSRRRFLATNPKWEAEMGHEQYKLLLDQYKGNVCQMSIGLQSLFAGWVVGLLLLRRNACVSGRQPPPIIQQFKKKMYPPIFRIPTQSLDPQMPMPSSYREIMSLS